MKIIIDNSSMIPIYEQIIEQLRVLILDNTLKANDPLPSVRALSKELKISALTVKKAYDQLEEQHLIETIHGKGSFVKEANQELLCNEQLMKIEEEFSQTIEKAQLFKISKHDTQAIFDLLMGDWHDKSK